VLDYDREAARYDATRGGDARADAAAHAIGTLLPAAAGGTARIADVGCGTGIVTARLLRPGRSVIGIDRSAGMAAVAATRLPGHITLGSVTRLPLASGSVNVVTMVWLLHLLGEAEAAAAVAEAGRVLSPGGLLITTVGKNDAAFGLADDAAAILGPVRAGSSATRRTGWPACSRSAGSTDWRWRNRPPSSGGPGPQSASLAQAADRRGHAVGRGRRPGAD
jgi:SAM-dependent methyltransferase